MAKKTTLADIGKLLKKDKAKGDTSYWGVVQSVNTTDGKVTSYNVSLGGDAGTVKCRKLAGAEIGDTVFVTLRSTGEAVVTGTKNGDKDALNAQNNYFWHDDDGAHISLLERVITGVKNILIDSNGLYIRNDTTDIASFTADTVELGKNSEDSIIKMCNGTAQMYKNNSGHFCIENRHNASLSCAEFGCSQSNNESTITLNARASNTSPQAGIIVVDNESRSYVSISCGSIHINGGTLADFVTEQGTSSGWNYRKWSSGKCELWRTYAENFAMNTQLYDWYTSSDVKTLTLPFSVNGAVCTATASEGQTNMVVAGASGTTFTYRPFRVKSSAAADRKFNFRIDAKCN